MLKKCTKCKGKGLYGYNKCSRCLGRGLPAGMMNRVTKTEKKARSRRKPKLIAPYWE